MLALAPAARRPAVAGRRPAGLARPVRPGLPRPSAPTARPPPAASASSARRAASSWSTARTETAIPLDRLVKLTREGDAAGQPARGSVVLFPDGDRLRAAIGAVRRQDARGRRPTSWATRPCRSRSTACSAWSSPRRPTRWRSEALLARVRDEPRKSEVLWLANGDRMTGGFLGLTAQKVTFQRDAGPAEIDRSARDRPSGFDPARRRLSRARRARRSS